MDRILPVLDRRVAFETSNISLRNVNLMKPCRISDLCLRFDMTFPTLFLGRLAGPGHRLAMTLYAAGTRLQKRLVRKSYFADSHFFSVFPMTDNAVLVVLWRSRIEVAQNAHSRVHIHMRLALHEGVVAARAMEILTPLFLVLVFQVVERRPAEIDDLRRFRLMAQDALLVVYTRLQR
jgi:hypothetical protein